MVRNDDGFLWLGNHPATDLCNTVPLVDGAPVELLPDFDAILRWARAAGVTEVREREAGAGRAATTRFVHRLRAALRAVLEARAPSHAPLDALNAVLAGERAVLQVGRSGPDRVRLRATSVGHQLGLDIAAAVVDVFHHDHRRIRCCAGPACILLYLDTSKSGRRRWCDMSTCGNRAKAAAHQARAHGR
jgi:predicted RNA-binding Zn ribbon-like protein